MKFLPFILRAMPMAVIAILISGCAGSGYLKDLNRYARKVKGPDIASSAATPAPYDAENRIETDTPALEQAGVGDAATTDGNETVALTESADVPSAKEASAKTGTRGNGGLTESHSTPATVSRVFKAPVTTEDRIHAEPRTKVRKSDRQPPEIEWGNNSRKDWFFLIMSGLGLVVGLFGVGFGWIVFLIFGGLFLYRKIVRRK